MTRRVPLLWILILIFLQHASAEYLWEWEPLVFPGLDEPIREMTFIPPQTYYVWTPSGLKKSLDGGFSWSTLSLPLLNGRPQKIEYVSIARTNPKVICAGNPSRVYRSEDEGAHWQEITPDIRLSSEWFQLGPVAISPFDENKIALNYDGPTGTGCLLFSEDGGNLWRCIGRYSYHDRFFIHPGTGEVFYRGIDGRYAQVYRVDFQNHRGVKILHGVDPLGYGFGFSSGDSELVYFAYRPGPPYPPEFTRQIYIRTNRDQKLIPIFPTENEVPDSIAYHAESGTLFLTVRERDRDLARVISSKDMGTTWTECGQLPAGSQLFFLPGHNALYAKSRIGIWRLELLTSLPSGGRLATTWGELKL